MTSWKLRASTMPLSRWTVLETEYLAPAAPPESVIQGLVVS